LSLRSAGMQAVIVAFWLAHVIALAPAHMIELTVLFSCQRRTPGSTVDMWKSVEMQFLQVGCPEARIDENVAKLTGAGYKVSLHKLLAPVGCTWPFATHTATCRSSLHTALCCPSLQPAEVVCIWPSAIHIATCRSGLQDIPAPASAQLCFKLS